MYRRGIFFRIMLAILLVVVITGGGFAAYRMGWGQGYLAGAAIVSEGLEPGLAAPGFGGHLYRPFYPGFGFPFWGLCLGIGFVLLVMFLAGGLLKPWRRRGWASHPHYGKWEHGPMPPWVKEWEKYRQKMSEDEPSGDDSTDEQESEQ